MDRLDRLTHRLLEALPRPDHARHCVPLDALGRLSEGRLDGPERERVDAHLNACLSCLDRFVTIRDELHALHEPGDVSPRLARTLDDLLGVNTVHPPAARRLGRIPELFEVRIPAWSVVTIAAVLLLTWIAIDRPPWRGMPASSQIHVGNAGDRLDPASARLPQRVSGVVSSVRDATVNGVHAHIVDLSDDTGARYVLFTWGRPTVAIGDRVETDVIFTNQSAPASPPVYQGLATAFRKSR